MPYALKDKSVLITGGSRCVCPPILKHKLKSVLVSKLTFRRGLGALVAEKFAAEGSNVAINYVANTERANQIAEKIKKNYKVKTVVIQGVGCIARHPLCIYLQEVGRTWVF